MPIPDITADIVSRTLLNDWISRFGCTQTMTTEYGRQFQLQRFHYLSKLCGIQLSRTTTYHPAVNGLAERFHQTLRAAMCHTNQQWTCRIPWFSASAHHFMSAFETSVADLVCGEPLRIPASH
jgi:transposase InsO family protein